MFPIKMMKKQTSDKEPGYTIKIPLEKLLRHQNITNPLRVFVYL